MCNMPCAVWDHNLEHRSVFAPIFDAFNEADNIRAEAEKLLAEVPKLTAVEAEAYLRDNNVDFDRLAFLKL